MERSLKDEYLFLKRHWAPVYFTRWPPTYFVFKHDYDAKLGRLGAGLAWRRNLNNTRGHRTPPVGFARFPQTIRHNMHPTLGPIVLMETCHLKAQSAMIQIWQQGIA